MVEQYFIQILFSFPNITDSVEAPDIFLIKQLYKSVGKVWHISGQLKYNINNWAIWAWLSNVTLRLFSLAREELTKSPPEDWEVISGKKNHGL